MTENRCAHCGKPCRDGYVCHADALNLAENLREAAGHAEDAWTVISRQARYGGGQRGGRDQPLPLDLTAAHGYRAIENTITTWARHIDPRASGSLPEVTRWLAGQLDWLRKQPEARDAFDELHDACLLAARLVDAPGPDTRRLVGMCDCGRILYAPHGRDVVQCRATNCGASWNVTESQDILRAALDNRHVTAAEAAHLAGFIDTDRTGNQIRKLINKWAERDVLDAHEVLVKHHHRNTCDDDCTENVDTIATYRFGDVADRIAQTPRRTAQTAGMGA